MPRKYTRRKSLEVVPDGEPDEVEAVPETVQATFLLDTAVLLHPGIGFPGRIRIARPHDGVLVTSDLNTIAALRRIAARSAGVTEV